MRCTLLAGVTALMLAGAPVLAQEPASETWDGLVEVKAKKLDVVFLMPEADFRGYTKVILEPTEVSFRKNWQRDQNRGTNGYVSQVSTSEARRILDQAQESFQDEFTKAFTKAGYQVVTEPGPDVLLLGTAIVNLDVAAPDSLSASATRVYTWDAGEATLVLEARDSETGALLGRAVDRRETDDNGPYVRNRATNIREFEQLFESWAEISIDGLADLRELSPIDINGLPRPR